MLLYVEQPFPYDLEAHRIDVHSVSARKPLFLDESAHDWQLRAARAANSAGPASRSRPARRRPARSSASCWAKAHGMTLMVQDLTNPMLAQIPHVLLAAHAGTIMGVETNGMQFYPDASLAEAAVHPGLYRRRDGVLDLTTLRGPGFGYRVEEIERELPPAAAHARSHEHPRRADRTLPAQLSRCAFRSVSASCCMTHTPHLVMRVTATDRWHRRCVDSAADNLIPKWFTKDPKMRNTATRSTTCLR